MNNELERKITSLTLMTIMVAGGMTFAIPGVMPAAYAASNNDLFVSAENSGRQNYMSGPQVIEVIVTNPNLKDTDEANGEPTVTVGGDELRMVQGTDGQWYGYFADLTQAVRADATTENRATGGLAGLDFGTFCGKESTVFSASGTIALFSETEGVAVAQPITEGVNGTDAQTDIPNCSSVLPASGTLSGTAHENVVREAEDINTNPNADGIGQINLASDQFWPFIQLYNLNPTGSFDVIYAKSGDPQSVTITFDTVDQFASVEKDRSNYPQGAQVHVTVTDLWLNIDPTDEDSWTFGTNSDIGTTTNYQVFDESGSLAGANLADGVIDISDVLSTLMIRDNGVLTVDVSAQTVKPGNPHVLTLQDNGDSNIVCTNTQLASTCKIGGVATGLGINTQPVTLTESLPNSGIFETFDDGDTSILMITDNAPQGRSGTVGYNENPISITTDFSSGSVDIKPIDDTWNSGEEIPVVVVDNDQNKNSRADEDLVVSDPNVTIIPALTTGDPFTLGEGGDNKQQVVFVNWEVANNALTSTAPVLGTISIESFSERARIANSTNIPTGYDAVIIDLGTTFSELKDTISNEKETDSHVHNFFNLDVRSFSTTKKYDVYLLNTTAAPDGIIKTGSTLSTDTIHVTKIVDNVAAQSLTGLDDTVNANLFVSGPSDTNTIGLAIVTSDNTIITDGLATDPIVADFFSFGFKDDGVQASERIANQIIRIEVEETSDNSGEFKGTLEYVMMNQINILDEDTFLGITPINDQASLIVIEDLTDEDALRVSYSDIDAEGENTSVTDQQAAPSHSGVVSLDKDSYKTADTVIITVKDQDLNVDSDLVDIYTVVDLGGTDASNDVDNDQVGINVDSSLEKLSFGSQGRLLDVTFNDKKWTNEDDCDTGDYYDGLAATGFTLKETGPATGIFEGSFLIQAQWCEPDGKKTTIPNSITTLGLDIEVNYVDYRDASGEIIEVGDSAGVRANTGSISLDRTVYPVPFGTPSDFTLTTPSSSPAGRSVFPIHSSGLSNDNELTSGEFLVSGDLTIHVRINDPDNDINPAGEDFIDQNVDGSSIGPVKISVIRGSDVVVLGYAGGDAKRDGLIDVKDNNAASARQFGPIKEIAPDAGIYELDLTIKFSDGPASTTCPKGAVYDKLMDNKRFDEPSSSGYCILQGDILQVEYTDPADASGDKNTVTDSATFDLRNGVLQSDKSVYIIGSDMILTLIEPDFDLDNDSAETYDLDLIEWDSDASTTTMGDRSIYATAFDPEPTDFRETGDSTGIFQVVIEIPESLGEPLERGEEILLEYTDWGPSGSDYVGDEDEDVNITLFTSNFGATVELDQKVYTWTDKVYITIVAPDHNFDSDVVDDIGNTQRDPIKVSTRGFDLDQYKLVETGTDTGIFTGEVILTGFATHDADGDGITGDASGITLPDNEGGPTDGKLSADDDDGLSVSFEFSEDETVVGSSLIRWNIGETQWLEASYPASGTGVIRIIDPDMNLNPEAVDNFNVDVWSDSDRGGVDLTVTETNEATGIFEGTVFFTTTDESSGHRLRVAESDTVTAEYQDNTLPDPYATDDELEIRGTSIIGTTVAPLERAPAANLRAVDSFGNSLNDVTVGQQIQISADLVNGQDKVQPFAYLAQIKNADGVTVLLSWITGSLTEGQSLSPSQSWTPTEAGTYTVTAFVWESVDNPTALSPTVSTTINVR